MHPLVSKFRVLKFWLLLSRVAPYLQFVTTNCLTKSKGVKIGYQNNIDTMSLERNKDRFYFSRKVKEDVYPDCQKIV